jgi:endonuclease/exonuclease/phosphatase family metal-dependent hydrolase
MSMRLRVLSYNIHKGFSFGNTRFLLDDIRNSIRLTHADLVFLQEVVGDHSQQQQRHTDWQAKQFEFLADQVWPHHAYGKNALYDHGHHGNAILSRYPLEQVDNHDVSLIPASQRGLLYSKIHPESFPAPLHVICLHFGLLAFERRRQVRQLCDLVTRTVASHEALVIAGDFNDWNLQADKYLRRQLGLQEALLQHSGKHAQSYPAFAPFLAMDRIYYRNLELLNANVLNGHPWNRLSDHCALYAEFRL